MLTSAGQLDLYKLGCRLREDYAGGILSNPPKLSEIECVLAPFLSNYAISLFI